MNVSLPLMLFTEAEYAIWSENSIEYVRMQVDQQSTYNPKKAIEHLIVSICSIKLNKK